MVNVAYNISVIIILYTKDKWSHEASNAFYRNAILLSGAKFPPFFFADLIVLSNFADRSRKYEVPWVSLSIIIREKNHRTDKEDESGSIANYI